ncbi:uncharacterized protein LOC124369343 isoform X2 [Homalodisca vitripennis]|uniref:Uncharacterized protein n=2 Tax=Homalodisca TaxID=139475 RepID=A0A1B6IYK7_9HEMI|nr:uncharacterized protein LOC124369343 isoform X2 [Homalodisca vitripennis]
MKCENADGSTRSCPGSSDPLDYTRCCWNSSLLFCCPQSSVIDSSHQRNVMLAGITVISACILVSILIIVCCFWSRCPLFKMCRVNYTHSEILSYSKEEEALRMPSEGAEGVHHYSPCHVVIKPVQEM